MPEVLCPALCARLGQLLGNQGDWVPADLPEAVGTHAQALAARFIAFLELVQPRSVGVEHLGLYALDQLQLTPLLESLGGEEQFWRTYLTLTALASVQRRGTACFAQKDGRTLSMRKATQPEPKLKAIYAALGVHPLPGGTKKGSFEPSSLPPGCHV